MIATNLSTIELKLLAKIAMEVPSEVTASERLSLAAALESFDFDFTEACVIEM